MYRNYCYSRSFSIHWFYRPILLGHAAFMAIGAYTAAILTYFYDVPFVLALLAGMVMAGLVSIILGFPTLRARLRGDYFAIATVGFGEAIRVILENLSITQGARGLPGIKHYTTLPVAVIFAASYSMDYKKFHLVEIRAKCYSS